MATSGTSVALNYGYNWLTGMKLQGTTLQNTGSDNLDYTRIGFWLLGEGEMDGLVEMWDTGLGRLLSTNETDDNEWMRFHTGCDSIIGSGQNPVSVGMDQGIDQFWTYLPAGLQMLNYNRWAYYAIKLKQLINNAPNDNQNDQSVWADVNPIGLWRGIRCRLFDSSGNMDGYAFTRNGAAHFVDLYCRRKFFPEYLIDVNNGAQDLPAAVKARFDFGALAESAAYFDETLSNGMPRFAGDYSFSQKTTLQACTEQILTCSRAFFQERAGKVCIRPDQPRASVFTFSRDNADSLVVSDSDVNTAPSILTGKFRDILVPACATIQSIVFDDASVIGPIITTEEPHCFVANDYIVIGNTGTAYDNYWQVDNVPDTNGLPVYQLWLKSRGSNYPAYLGSGGLMGLRYSRFKDRAPIFQHKAMQIALGAVGVGIPRQRNKRNQDTDFANCTWDQVARISKYQRGLALGADVTPFVTPPRLTLKTPLFASDAANSGAIALQIEPGDVVTIDSLLSDALQGLWEATKIDATLTGDGNGSSQQGGSLDFTLRPYSDANYPDENQGTEPGWPVVPVLPGNGGPATYIPLASGEAVFFTGSCADQDSFQLPDGFSKAKFLCWASPQGSQPSTQTLIGTAGAHLHFIQDCDAYGSAKCTLVYNDSAGSTWPGDVNYCGIAWRTETSARVFTIQTSTFVEMTLAGGEKILFGKGQVNSGAQIATPSTYDVNKIMGFAYPKSASDYGKATHGVASWVSNAGNAHHRYMWAANEVWEGLATVMVVGILNNLGTWLSHGNGWKSCPLPDGRRLALSGISIYTSEPNALYGDNSLPLVIGSSVPPMPGMSSETIQCMPVTDGFDYIGGSVSAHGIKQCTVDLNSLNVTALFYDGGVNTWGGSTSVFSLLCDTPNGNIFGDPIPADPTRWPGNMPDPTSGGGGGGGGVPPPACTVRGTLLTTPDGQLSNEAVMAAFTAGESTFLSGRDVPERIKSAEWVPVDRYWLLEIEGCVAYGASGTHTLRLKDGRHVWCQQIPDGTPVETEKGWMPLRKTLVERQAEVLKIELEGPSHEYWVGGSITHNVKPITTFAMQNGTYTTLPGDPNDTAGDTAPATTQIPDN